MFWMHTPVLGRFPSYPSTCHQSHWHTEEDIGAERRGDCVLVRGAPSSTSSSRWSVRAWLMTHGLQNTSGSEPPMHIKYNLHMHKEQSNLLYVIFNCPLNSSGNNLRVHNTFTRGRRSCLWSHVIYSVKKKCMQDRYLDAFPTCITFEKKTLQLSTINVHPLRQNDPKGSLWIFL